MCDVFVIQPHKRAENNVFEELNVIENSIPAAIILVITQLQLSLELTGIGRESVRFLR